MQARSSRQAGFNLEQSYPQSPARVFALWGDREKKARWFGVHDSSLPFYRLDFRVGGEEFNRIEMPCGSVYEYLAFYRDIVPDRRIVFTHDLRLDAGLISVCVTTVEFLPAGKGTQLVLEEHGVYLDGLQDPDDRKNGNRFALNNLAADLKRAEGEKP